MVTRGVGCSNRSLLCCKRRTFSRATKTERSRTLPAQRVARLVRDGNDRVVERRLDKDEAVGNVLTFALLELFALCPQPICSFAGSVSSPLLGHLLLTGNCALARALAGTSVRVGALAAYGKAAAMAKSAVGLDFDQALDVQRDVFAQIAFYPGPLLRSPDGCD